MHRASGSPRAHSVPLLALFSSVLLGAPAALALPSVHVATEEVSLVVTHVVPWHLGALFAALVVTAGLLSAVVPEQRKRLRTAAVLFLLYVFGFAVGGLFELAKATHYAGPLWWMLELLETLLALNLAALLFFDLALRRLRVKHSTLVSDLAMGAGYFVSIIHEMHRVGFNLSSIVTTGAVVSGVVGFAVAPSIGNILGGVALQLDNSLSEGDWIQLDANTQGKVKSIRWRHTVVETRNWDTIIVPNVTLLSSNITILGKRADQPRQRRFWVFFNVDFRFAPGDVIRVVNEALQNAPIANVATDPKPNVVCMDFAKDNRDSFAYYGARYWLTDLAVDDPTNSLVRERIYAALKRAGMPLALPATTVFVSNDDDAHAQLKVVRERERRMALLKKITLFKDLTEDEHKHLAEALVHTPFARDEVMTHQGREAHWLYLLAKGSADIILTDDDGTQRKVSSLEGPDFFGERGVMTGEPRSASVVSKTACECYRLDKEAFRKVLVERPELAEAFTAALLKRRGALLATQEGLDADQAARGLEKAHARLLSQIQSFFGLSLVG